MTRKPPARLPLDDAVRRLEQIAPLDGAEPWDNVGLLVRPAAPAPVRTVLITLDLTLAVLEEARRGKADLIVSYHPPLFTPLKRLDARDPRTAPLLMALESGIAIYSPHTALDAIADGVGDWLAEAFGSATRSAFGRSLPDGSHSAETGPGRLLDLKKPATLLQLARRLQRFLGPARLRMAPGRGLEPAEHPLRRIALCPGAGSGILLDAEADLLVTGEMKHHDLLACAESGRSVLLCGHAESERGFLPRYAERIRSQFGSGIAVRVAQSDQGPLADAHA